MYKPVEPVERRRPYSRGLLKILSKLSLNFVDSFILVPRLLGAGHCVRAAEDRGEWGGGGQ